MRHENDWFQIKGEWLNTFVLMSCCNSWWLVGEWSFSNGFTGKCRVTFVVNTGFSFFSNPCCFVVQCSIIANFFLIVKIRNGLKHCQWNFSEAGDGRSNAKYENDSDEGENSSHVSPQSHSDSRCIPVNSTKCVTKCSPETCQNCEGWQPPSMVFRQRHVEKISSRWALTRISVKIQQNSTKNCKENSPFMRRTFCRQHFTKFLIRVNRCRSMWQHFCLI